MRTRSPAGLIGLATVVSASLLLVAISVLVTDTNSGLAGIPTVVNSTVDTSIDDGFCTLREAIESANADAASGATSGECSGPDFDSIEFNIPTSDPGYDSTAKVWVIQPAPLPPVTSVVTIDGYTQPGAIKNDRPLAQGTNAQLKIVLDGETQPVNALELRGGNSVVRGLVTQDWNFRAIYVNTAGGNRIEGNFIGTDPTGTQRVQMNNGIELASSNNVIGGPDAADRNIISGISSPNTGVFVNNQSDNLIQGNLVGTNATGTQEIHTGFGIGIHNGSSNNQVIGNVVSGNAVAGVAFHGPGNVLQGNLIGTSADQQSPLPNGEYGVILGGGVSNSLVGGPNPEDANVIAFNGQESEGYGIFVSGTGNTIQGNSIHSTEGGLGIDFDGDLATAPNDAGDTDGGANNGQNYPEIVSAQAGSAHLEGTFDSTPNTLFRLEFFSNTACDPTGFGEGQHFIGPKNVTTDGDGVIDWEFDTNSSFPLQTYITATATNLATGDTSEFSNCMPLTPAPTPTPSPTPSGTASPSATPTATQTGTPSVTTEPSPTPAGTPPVGESVVWGDANCSGSADPVDSLLTLRHDAGLSADTGACPDFGRVVDVADASLHVWGDVDCSADVTPVDSLKLLRFDAGLSVVPATGCPVIGSDVLVVE